MTEQSGLRGVQAATDSGSGQGPQLGERLVTDVWRRVVMLEDPPGEHRAHRAAVVRDMPRLQMGCERRRRVGVARSGQRWDLEAAVEGDDAAAGVGGERGRVARTGSGFMIRARQG